MTPQSHQRVFGVKYSVHLSRTEAQEIAASTSFHSAYFSRKPVLYNRVFVRSTLSGEVDTETGKLEKDITIILKPTAEKLGVSRAELIALGVGQIEICNKEKGTTRAQVQTEGVTVRIVYELPVAKEDKFWPILMASEGACGVCGDTSFADLFSAQGLLKIPLMEVYDGREELLKGLIELCSSNDAPRVAKYLQLQLNLFEDPDNWLTYTQAMGKLMQDPTLRKEWSHIVNIVQTKADGTYQTFLLHQRAAYHQKFPHLKALEQELSVAVASKEISLEQASAHYQAAIQEASSSM